MLHDFLIANREELIVRCRVKAAKRRAPIATDRELQYGVPVFLDQLANVLSNEHLDEDAEHSIGRSSSIETEVAKKLDQTADRHGKELQVSGFTVDQVVHGYGDVCQAVTELAMETHVAITVAEFHILNRSLDSAIAHAVSRFALGREQVMADNSERTLNESLGFLAHELRNLTHTAMIAVNVLKLGGVGISGSTGAVLDRSLRGIRDLIDRTLVDVRLKAGIENVNGNILLSEFIEETRIAATIDAQAHDVELIVPEVEPELAIKADPQILAGAVANLLQNAFKFTKPRGTVWLRAYSSLGRILIEVEDQCGGLPQGDHEDLFRLFEQKHKNRNGVGLGLGISRRAVNASGGHLRVSDRPGAGCTFTIDLPQK
jgi:signal transduction histidine kinase